MDKGNKHIEWLAASHELWKTAVLKRAEEIYPDNPEFREEAHDMIDAALNVQPPLPWEIVRESQLDKKTRDSLSLASSPHDFLIIATDGTVVGRIAGHLDDAAEMVLRSGALLCDVALSVHDAMNSLMHSFDELQEFYAEEQKDLLDDDDEESFEDKYYRTLSWLKTFLAANNNFSPIQEVSEGRGVLVSELFHPESPGSDTGIQWGVWEVEDPDLSFKYWVGGFRIIEDGEATQGELFEAPQTESEGDDEPTEGFKTLAEMRVMVAQESIPIQLESGVPIDPRFQEWIDRGDISVLD